MTTVQIIHLITLALFGTAALMFIIGFALKIMNVCEDRRQRRKTKIS